MVSLTQLREVPLRKMVLLVGPPGAGKSTFCQGAVLQSLATHKPVIFVTTEYGPSDAERALRELGLREVEPGLLNFVDAYHETKGPSVSDRPDTVYANCGDLSSIGIAISQLSGRIGRSGLLLVFDSLTTPYLFSGLEVLRFMRITLSGFAAEGNAVLACVDEGSCKSEDLVAMMSVADGVIKTALGEDKQVLEIIKHPEARPARIEVPRAGLWKRNILRFCRQNIFTFATSILFVLCLVLPWGLGQEEPIINQVTSTILSLESVVEDLTASPSLAGLANALTPFVVLFAAVISIFSGIDAGIIGLVGMALSLAGSSAPSAFFLEAGLGWYLGWAASILCLLRSRLGRLVGNTRSS
jgi:KaiC/GvpD/RAD55 family RecA-like ATPase